MSVPSALARQCLQTGYVNVHKSKRYCSWICFYKKKKSDDPLVVQLKATKEAGLTDELILSFPVMHHFSTSTGCSVWSPPFDKKLIVTEQLAADHRPVALWQHRPRPPPQRWAGSPASSRRDQSGRFAWHRLSPTGDVSLSHDGRQSARRTSGLMLPYNENFPESSSLTLISFFFPLFHSKYLFPEQLDWAHLKVSKIARILEKQASTSVSNTIVVEVFWRLTVIWVHSNFFMKYCTSSHMPLDCM